LNPISSLPPSLPSHPHPPSLPPPDVLTQVVEVRKRGWKRKRGRDLSWTGCPGKREGGREGGKKEEGVLGESGVMEGINEKETTSTF